MIRSTIALAIVLTAALAALGQPQPLAAGKAPSKLMPLRVALVAEEPAFATVADVLTVELSRKDSLQLLERAESEKIYSEQGLTTANKDYLKLGQVLGADGLLLLSRLTEGTNQFLAARLVAVKPGVVIEAVRFPWPLPDAAQWAKWIGNHFSPLFPKLGVLAKDALPVSVVNLRSSLSSVEGQETERQLTALAIERLTRERELFVLERRRMELLSGEKELRGMNESAFWNGSYLLDGVVDRDGFAKETVTLSARLVPPRGGSPILIEVSGSRTNLSEAVNRLAVKILAGLKLSSSGSPWNPADEAAQYFEEAKWAMTWGIIPQAQAAAESAWSLGKRDLDCAILRVRAYMVSPDAGERIVSYPPKKHPDPQNIAFAPRGLELYNELSHNLPPDEPKVNSAWYRLGIEGLTVASRVLQLFSSSPDFYKPVAEKLAELRAAVRSTAEWICRSPSVHDSYFVGDRVAAYSELDHFSEQPNIFGLKVDCGSLWQEAPEAGVALYRDLMSSPVFCYLHDRFATQAQLRKEIEQRRQDLFRKYDRNRNGVIDPEEKEEALDDPAFIESELTAIDANHNGRLDAGELAWFDANQNRILDPKELAGIAATQHLLAPELLKTFDANGDRFLDRSEFNEFWLSGSDPGVQSVPGFLFPDENHDGHIDLRELEAFLTEQTSQGLRLRGMPVGTRSNQVRTNANGLIDRQQLFKAAVESYWQSPASRTNGQPFNRGTLPGRRGGVTNSVPNGKTP